MEEEEEEAEDMSDFPRVVSCSFYALVQALYAMDC